MDRTTIDLNIEKMIDYGIKLVENGLTKGTGGNLSFYDRENKLMYISPSGIEFDKIKPSDIAVLDENSKQISGDKKPSSEWYMHQVIYKKRKDINFVIHAHTMYATIMACLRWNLPASHYMIAVAGGKDVRCAEYATFGSRELGDNAVEAMKDRKCCLLANHGIIAGDMSFENAFNIIEEIEYCSEIYTKAKSIGQPIVLDDAEMEIMKEKFRTYGNKNLDKK